MGTAINQAKLDELLARVRREIDNGILPSCQLAVAKDGELVAFEAYGDATTDTRYVMFSSTKAVVENRPSSAVRKRGRERAAARTSSIVRTCATGSEGSIS